VRDVYPDAVRVDVFRREVGELGVRGHRAPGSGFEGGPVVGHLRRGTRSDGRNHQPARDVRR
jgi:hypothetical protein